MNLSLVINGCEGKMGREVAVQSRFFPQIKEIIGIDKKNLSVLSESVKFSHRPLLIDFSSVQGALSILKYCLRNKIPAVVGTTGFSEKQKNEILSVSKKIPVFLSSNMSAAVNLTFLAVEFLAKNLDFDIHIHEIHHTAKKDAPSGTALTYASFVQKAGKKPKITSARIGDIKGEHEITFAGPGEKIILKHCAFDRSIFARGAIKAGLWLYQKKNGLYSFQDYFKVRI